MTDSAERLLLWVDDHGGASQVSKIVGLDRQVFHSLKTKDIYPSLPTLKKMHTVYPTLDIHWIGTGEKREGIVYPAIERKFIEMDYERLKLELQEAKIELLQTKSEKVKLFDLLGKDEGETDAYLVDTEIGFKMMNLIRIIQQGGFALGERNN